MKEALNNNSLLNTQTTTAVKKENINEAFFPLYFSIILKNAFNMTVLESHGYPTVYKFFDGLMSDIVNDMDMDMKRFDWRGNQNTTIQSMYSFIWIFVKPKSSPKSKSQIQVPNPSPKS